MGQLKFKELLFIIAFTKLHCAKKSVKTRSRRSAACSFLNEWKWNRNMSSIQDWEVFIQLFFFSFSIQFKRKDAVEVNATNIGHTKQTYILSVIFIEGLFTFQQLHSAALKSARMQTPQENISVPSPKTHQYVCETENMTTEAPVIATQIIMVVLPEVLQLLLPPLACAKYNLLYVCGYYSNLYLCVFSGLCCVQESLFYINPR